MRRAATVSTVFRRFVHEHYACGTLTGDVRDVTAHGYTQRLLCSCGATFARRISAAEQIEERLERSLFG